MRLCVSLHFERWQIWQILLSSVYEELLYYLFNLLFPNALIWILRNKFRFTLQYMRLYVLLQEHFRRDIPDQKYHNEYFSSSHLLRIYWCLKFKNV
jgi:hypothetical protein